MTSTSSANRPPPIPLSPRPPKWGPNLAPREGGGGGTAQLAAGQPSRHGLGSPVLRTAPGLPGRQDHQGIPTPAGYDPPGSSAPSPPHRSLSLLTGMPRPDPRGQRTISGPDLAPSVRRFAQRIKAPGERHCLALLDRPNALGWPSVSRQMGAPSSPQPADGGAHASKWRADPVSQRMTSPLPALLGRD